MQRFFLVLVFAFSLFLKVATVAGAELDVSESAVIQTPNDTVLVANLEKQETEVADPKQSSQIQNTINVTPTPVVAYAQPTAEVSSVLVNKHLEESQTEKISLMPMIGGSGFNGRWYDHITNAYTLGLALDIPLSKTFSLEAEGSYGKYNIAYSYYGHEFNQYSIGGNGKIYLSRGVFQPYIGGGMLGLYYDNMTHGPYNPARYSQWLGAVQAIAGADVALASQVAIGLRGAWVVPFLNRPTALNNGYNAYPYYEEASAMNTTFFRIMGTAKISF